MRGKFITFEGGEGAGKSTQIVLLRKALEQDGHRVTLTREPGGDKVSEGIRTLLLSNEMSPRAELLLFLGARAQNVEEVIRPALNRGEIVLCDRFIDSSAAYQGVARGLGRDIVASLNQFAVSGVIPDVTFLLDIDPEVGLNRQNVITKMEMEALEFHFLVRKGFLDEAQRDPNRICVLDADRSSELIHFDIINRVRHQLSADL